MGSIWSSRIISFFDVESSMIYLFYELMDMGNGHGNVVTQSKQH